MSSIYKKDLQDNACNSKTTIHLIAMVNNKEALILQEQELPQRSLAIRNFSFKGKMSLYNLLIGIKI